jgi:hypothetical protein
MPRVMRQKGQCALKRRRRLDSPAGAGGDATVLVPLQGTYRGGGTTQGNALRSYPIVSPKPGKGRPICTFISDFRPLSSLHIRTTGV